MGLEQFVPLALPAIGGFLQWLSSRSKRDDAVVVAWQEDRAALHQLRIDHDELVEKHNDLDRKFQRVIGELELNNTLLVDRERTIAVQVDRIKVLEAENLKLKITGIVQ